MHKNYTRLCCHGQLWKQRFFIYHSQATNKLFFVHRFIQIFNKNKLIMQILMSCLVTKPTKWALCPAKTEISLGIRPVWSESSLCTQWVAKDPRFLHADSEDSDQTGRMSSLGAHAILLVLWQGALIESMKVSRIHGVSQVRKKENIDSDGKKKSSIKKRAAKKRLSTLLKCCSLLISWFENKYCGMQGC